jgi:hypothetical protein
MTKIDPHANVKRLVLVSWALVALFYFYLCYDYIRVDMSASRMGEYVHYVVQLAGNENRTGREIRALLLVRAEELGVPLTGDQIRIQGSGKDLKVSLDYDVSIDIPILRQDLYSKHYEHTAVYRTFR